VAILKHEASARRSTLRPGSRQQQSIAVTSWWGRTPRSGSARSSSRERSDRDRRELLDHGHCVLRDLKQSKLPLGSNVLVGLRAYLTGRSIEDDVFLATGCSVFNGAFIGRKSEVRINGIVHLKTRLP
jgi:hypothetical protein